MPGPTLGEIHIRRRELTILRRVLSAAQPWEGCALLLGARPSHSGAVSGDCAGGPVPASPPSPALRILLIWPCLNVWDPPVERSRRFLLDPREQLLAQRWARDRGLQVLGAAHSHPCSAAVPSATDLELAVAPTLQLILSPLQDWQPFCWWLEPGPDGSPRPWRLQWKMVD